jgi:hypothetical protein
MNSAEVPEAIRRWSDEPDGSFGKHMAAITLEHWLRRNGKPDQADRFVRYRLHHGCWVSGVMLGYTAAQARQIVANQGK